MRRCLVIANRTLASPPLLAELRTRQAGGEESVFHILVPATHAHGSTVWTEGQALTQARAALERALEDLRSEGIDASGEVGDENPVLAVEDVLNRQAFDEIVVSTLPAGISKWLKRDLPRRLARRFGLPVTHVVAVADRVG